ncbi:pyrroloquinoline quinone biosynthesis peptide chaperone PqqD [Hyphomicrobium sp.]|jgi:pyrroloquinoline quinone biosynthesis protein D|uniref:pyrroloquinoline quinone biosynthesis peptide chaperone PqqD n=1 Tax=Hyphomicrobium sp. TaxID=82 RepID=UPI002D806B77|nr:pyrroloquinoline quinone biosynthesis peptide chaperone PqqD [Hyphomicrobium sp.]
MMEAGASRTRTMIVPESKPGMPPHIKLRHDPGRGRWHVLAPERVFEPDPIAIEILKRCDGATTVQQIATDLAKDYNAPLQEILTDTISMLQELSDKGVIKA